VKPAYHHRDLRHALVDEALRVLQSDGPEALTLRELGRRLGVTHAAPYAHFADKAALLLEVAEAGFDRLAAALTSARDAGGTPRAALEAMGHAYVGFARSSPHLYRLMFADASLFHGRGETAPPIGEQAFSILIEAVAALKSREPAALLDASVTVWSMVHGLAMLEIDHRLAAKVDPSLDVVTAATRVLFDGLL
jgi:AcrR family transcriptional regulator